jgi:hypothetical protein
MAQLLAPNRPSLHAGVEHVHRLTLLSAYIQALFICGYITTLSTSGCAPSNGRMINEY